MNSSKGDRCVFCGERGTTKTVSLEDVELLPQGGLRSVQYVAILIISSQPQVNSESVKSFKRFEVLPSLVSTSSKHKQAINLPLHCGFVVGSLEFHLRLSSKLFRAIWSI